jgi:hypothetical protein
MLTVVFLLICALLVVALKRALAQAAGPDESGHVADASSLSEAARTSETRTALEHAYEALGTALGKAPRRDQDPEDAS